MESKRFRILLLRSLLGGAVGGLILAAWSVIGQKQFQTNWDQWLAVIFFLYALPYGLALGGITSIAIWLIHRYTQANLGPVIRSIIGTAIGITVLWLMTRRTENVSTTWQHQFLGFVLYGICIGGLPGLFVGSQARSTISARS